ncbi:MAG TPA: hypothetical protein VNK95_23125 [Caldilineaceae bacterium]|nr:hypothetical protein [Caldilineaceae bacterium]
MKTQGRWPTWALAALGAVVTVLAAFTFLPATSRAAGALADSATGTVQTTVQTVAGAFGWRGGSAERDAQLAEALGITVEELQAARDEVFAEELAAAVADGRLTQEEADQLQAQRALRRYLSERLQTAYKEAVQQAVEDGVITQEQADALLAEPGWGFFGRGFGGPRGHGMRGGMWGGDRPGRGLWRAPLPDTAPNGTPDATPAPEETPQDSSFTLPFSLS